MNQTLVIQPRKLPKTIATVNEIAVVLLNVFSNHVSEANSITKEDLFKKLFGRFPKQDDLGDYLRWDFTRKAMHLLRQRSNCFIVNKYLNNSSEFFVAKTEKDAQYYVDRLNKNIKSMKLMQNRCLKSVREKWYDKRFDIMLPEMKIKQLPLK